MIAWPDPAQTRFSNHSANALVAKAAMIVSRTRSAPFRQTIEQMRGFNLSDNQAPVHHYLQVTLERTTVYFGAQTLEILVGHAAVLQDVAEGLGLRS